MATTYANPYDPRKKALDDLMGAPMQSTANGMAQGAAAPGYDVTQRYAQMGDLLKGSADTQLANTLQGIYGQQAGINQGYDALNAQTYANARLSALGNNEALAAAGLAGAPTAGPQSGYSETSRVRQDAALGGALNANQLARRNALDALTQQTGQAQLESGAALMGQQANLLGQQAQAEQNQYQFDTNMGFQREQDMFNRGIAEAGLTGMYGGQQTLQAQQMARQLAMEEAGLTGLYDGQKTLQAQQLEQQQQQQQVDNAMNRVNLMGYVDEQTAAILGLPVGTPSWQANAWKQEFDLQKKQAASRGSGSSGGITADQYSALLTQLTGLLGSGKAPTAGSGQTYTPSSSTIPGMPPEAIAALKKAGVLY
jgi:hypothetical protein